VHVARDAGVSVGTLYQYFPNKQSLLFAVLDQHLTQVADALEEACVNNQGQTLERMMSELVKRFIEAKIADRQVAVALYRIAGELGGDLIVDRFRNRCERAIAAMLQSANLNQFADIKLVSGMIFLTMAGVLRGYLEKNASIRNDHKIREQLTKLLYAYCSSL
jgi:AcrR family transcriptional regulator